MLLQHLRKLKILPYLLNICRKFELLIFQGILATSLRWDGQCRMGFVANFICFPAVQKFRKSVKIWHSCGEFKGEFSAVPVQWCLPACICYECNVFGRQYIRCSTTLSTQPLHMIVYCDTVLCLYRCPCHHSCGRFPTTYLSFSCRTSTIV